MDRRIDDRRVVVLADDLIWATRLEGQLRTLGASPLRVRSLGALEDVLGEPAAPGRVVIDLTARAYDGIAGVRLAAASRARILCVGQHDDASLRRAARDAGAEQVVAYRALFEHGHQMLARWLGVPVPPAGSLERPSEVAPAVGRTPADT